MRNSRIPHIVKRRSLTDLKAVENPIKVTYQNLTASIKYYPSDGLFHGYWNIGGIKGKAASKTLEGAEAKDALRKIHQGRGQLSELSNRGIASLNATPPPLISFRRRSVTTVFNPVKLIALRLSGGFDGILMMNYAWETSRRDFKFAHLRWGE